jgi:hypothetical protein
MIMNRSGREFNQGSGSGTTLVTIIILVMVVLPFAFGGLLFGAFGAWEWYRGAKTEDWAAATATIAEAKVVESRRTDSDGRRSTTYSVKLVYEYTVDGEAYEGSRIRYGALAHNDRSDAKAEKSKYEKGKKVEVFYDPEEPSSAVLERGTGSAGLIFACVGLAVLVFSLGMAFIVPKMISGRSNASHDAVDRRRSDSF